MSLFMLLFIAVDQDAIKGENIGRSRPQAHYEQLNYGETT
jgi:hypothetical protein